MAWGLKGSYVETCSCDVMTEGNWQLGVFVDETASEEQADKLVKVFTGQLGGSMAGVAPLVGELLGVELAAIEVQDDGVRHSVRIGDVIDFEIEDIVPFGIEYEGKTGLSTSEFSWAA